MLHRRSRTLVLLAVLCVNAWLLVTYHDHFWAPGDDGYYAHIADRMLDGEVLYRDIQDVHPGYVNFVNVGAMKVFGRRMVSMRYPLVLTGLVQCAIVFLILAPTGLAAAAVGATALTAFGFLQFIDPSGHWYVVFLAVAIAGVLHLVPPDRRWRIDVVGALAMTAVLFQQLSGVLVSMGAVTCLLLDHRRDRARRERITDDGASPRSSSRPTDAVDAMAPPRLARALAALMLAGLVGYLLLGTEQVGWAFFGIWPVLLLVWALRSTRLSDRETAAATGRLLRGAALAALPLVTYLAVHGAFAQWYRDAIVVALAFPTMSFFDDFSHASQIHDAIVSVTSGRWHATVAGTLWLMFPFVAAAVGVVLLRQVASRAGFERPAPPPLAVIACFQAVVAVHFQIPIYLIFTLGLSSAALLLLGRGNRAVVGTVAVMIPLAVYYHAGRTLPAVVDWHGEREPQVEAAALSRLGLKIYPEQVDQYTALLEAIDRETPPGTPIVALPYHPDVYFLSDRRNPVRYINMSFAMATPEEMAAAQRELAHISPGLIIFAPTSDRSPHVQEFMRWVRANHVALPKVGRFELYRPPGDVVAGGGDGPSSTR